MLEVAVATIPGTESHDQATSGNAGPCYIAHVMIIPQPSAHASLGGCGGTKNSQVLKISTTENEALSTICCFFSGPRATSTPIEH